MTTKTTLTPGQQFLEDSAIYRIQWAPEIDSQKDKKTEPGINPMHADPTTGVVIDNQESPVEEKPFFILPIEISTVAFYMDYPEGRIDIERSEKMNEGQMASCKVSVYHNKNDEKPFWSNYGYNSSGSYTRGTNIFENAKRRALVEAMQSVGYGLPFKYRYEPYQEVSPIETVAEPLLPVEPLKSSPPKKAPEKAKKPSPEPVQIVRQDLAEEEPEAPQVLSETLVEEDVSTTEVVVASTKPYPELPVISPTVYQTLSADKKAEYANLLKANVEYFKNNIPTTLEEALDYTTSIQKTVCGAPFRRFVEGTTIGHEVASLEDGTPYTKDYTNQLGYLCYLVSKEKEYQADPTRIIRGREKYLHDTAAAMILCDAGYFDYEKKVRTIKK